MERLFFVNNGNAFDVYINVLHVGIMAFEVGFLTKLRKCNNIKWLRLEKGWHDD